MVIYRILEVFHDEFYRWRYMEFSKLDQHIRKAFKKTFMTKEIYIGTSNSYINQRLANIIINE